MLFRSQTALVLGAAVLGMGILALARGSNSPLSKPDVPAATGNQGTPSPAQEAIDRALQETAIRRGAITITADDSGQVFILLPPGKELGRLPAGSGRPPILTRSKLDAAAFDSIRAEADAALKAAGFLPSGGYVDAASGKLVIETAEPDTAPALAAILAKYPDLIDHRPGLTTTLELTRSP